LADEHGLNNNYTIGDIQLYYTSLLPEFEKRGVNYVYLSDIYKQYHFVRKEALNEIRKTLPETRWEEVNIRKQLEEMASKHNNLEDNVYAAQQYYLLRTLEKKLLENYFSGQIFIAYSGNFAQQVYPYLPTLYIFTEKKGYSELPRFK
jgi:anaerobic ribonucleoside-triphosphate reductase